MCWLIRPGAYSLFVQVIENDEESTQLMTMNIPVLNEGDGDDLTILLGLDSIEEKKGAVQTDPEHRVLTFPGPGATRLNRHHVPCAYPYHRLRVDIWPSRLTTIRI